MKNTIRKILREDQMFKKSNYYKKVAKMIVDSLDIDHDSRIITIPFISPWGNRKDYFYRNGETGYVLEYEKDYLLMPDLIIYLQKYGLQPQRGILMVIIKLIEKGIQQRINNHSTTLTESDNKRQRFFDFVINKIVSGIHWKQLDVEWIEVEWPMYYDEWFVDEVSLFTGTDFWDIGTGDRNYLNNVFGVADKQEQQYVMDEVLKRFQNILLDKWITN